MSTALTELCRSRTDLDDSDIDILLTYEGTLATTAELLGSDAFIDVMDKQGCAFVAAQASPKHFPSQYETKVLGLAALEADEPAVYRAFNEGLPCRDIVANTQEHKTVSQDTAPIKNANGVVIGVLVVEHDISRILEMERKLEAVSSAAWTDRVEPEKKAGNMQLREAHHRLKNHLQILSNTCNIQSRRAKCEETRLALSEVVCRIRSIAALNQLLSDAGQASGRALNLDTLLRYLVQNIKDILSEEYEVEFIIDCPPLLIDHSSALPITLIVNELIVNFIKHGRHDACGEIRITVHQGNRYGSLMFSDNGRGFAAGAILGNGLTLARSLVQSELNGDLHIDTSATGTKVVFSFEMLGD